MHIMTVTCSELELCCLLPTLATNKSKKKS